MAKEIERKFLVNNLPPALSRFSHVEISQGYLPSRNPNLEIRIRREGFNYFYTRKSKGKGLVREEEQESLTEKDFNRYWKRVKKRLEKVRYKIPHEDFAIELDIYYGNLQGLITAEVEFPDEQTANKFKIPLWFGKEVTHEERYRNRLLAEKGFPN